jgi:hypothetical protein
MTVLIKYIAQLLGIRTDVDDDEVIVEVPGLNAPTNVTVTPAGAVVIPNALNSTTTHLTAVANIIAGQAAGGKAELYIGSRLVAIDADINAADTKVTFTTSDGSPANTELQAAVPAGGLVTVMLYNAAGISVTSVSKNPVLIVDYAAPTLTGITSAVYNAAGKYLYMNVTGAGAINDAVDVTKISLTDASLGKTYNLTNAPTTGSKGIVSNTGILYINVGSFDKASLTGFGGPDVTLNVAAGAFLKDTAGNAINIISAIPNIPVSVINNGESTGLNAPTNVTVAASGGNIKANTLNSTNLYMTAAASITTGQATNGKAELYVGSRLVAIDSVISATDTTVDFTTSDSTPVNGELQAAIPAGGVVTVKLYNYAGISVVSVIGNPTLSVDYTAPTIAGIISAAYIPATGQLYITVTGASAINDAVDVTKISLTDTGLSKTYYLTNASVKGSKGAVISPNLLTVNVGSADKAGLAGFEGSDVTLNAAIGSLLTDAAGNASTAFTTIRAVPVTVIQ